jgi:hypothetical protein
MPGTGCYLTPCCVAAFLSVILLFPLTLFPLLAPPRSYLPALSAAVNVFLLGQLKRAAYVRFGWWTLIVTGGRPRTCGAWG